MVYEKIKEFHEFRPFKPFDIKMSDGRVYTIDHPEFLMQSRSRKYVIYTTEDDRKVILVASHITASEVANTHAA
jgi:hypothetical protein